MTRAMEPSAGETDLYYDAYDTEFDDDLYPVRKGLRDEAPLYYNEKLELYALSRRHRGGVAFRGTFACSRSLRVRSGRDDGRR